MLHLGLLHDDSDFGQAVSNITGPIGISECPKALRNGLIQAVRRNLDRVLDTVQVATSDPTHPECQTGTFALYWTIKAPQRWAPQMTQGDFATMRCCSDWVPLP
jgi:hypothetical protein